MPDPIAVIVACGKHRLNETTIERIGIGGTDASDQHAMTILMCQDCWKKDRDAMEALMTAINLEEFDKGIIRKFIKEKIPRPNEAPPFA